MNVNEISAMANKLSIPQLQQALRDGSLPPYVGIPLLQQKVKMQQAAKNAQGAGQPKPPTVAEQVEGEAQQASMEDMMRKRALAMQAEMGQTGGISDFLKKPEAMATGGEVKRFAVGDIVPSASLYDEDLSIDDATALRALSPDQLNYFSTLPNGREAAIGAGRKLIQQQATKSTTQPANTPQRYSNVFTEETPSTRVPYFKTSPNEFEPKTPVIKEAPFPPASQRPRNIFTDDVTAPIKTPHISDMPEMQTLTKRLLEEKPKGVDIPAYTPTNVPDNDIPLQAQPAVRGVAPGMAENLNVLNQQAAQAADQRSMAERMQLRQEPTAPRPPAVNQNATPYGAAIAAQQQNQGTAPVEKDQTLSDYMKQYRDVTGENKGIGALRDRLAERESRIAKEEERAPWMALMSAGLGMMSGTSPFALANIGQGGQQGLQAYTHAMNKLEDAKDKSYDLQAKIEDSQRREQLAAANYGLESVKADKAAKQTERLLDKKIAAEKDIAAAKNALGYAELESSDAYRKGMIGLYEQGAKGSPEVLAYNELVKTMQADPKAYPELRTADGKGIDPLKARRAASIAVATNKETTISPEQMKAVTALYSGARPGSPEHAYYEGQLRKLSGLNSAPTVGSTATGGAFDFSSFWNHQ